MAPRLASVRARIEPGLRRLHGDGKLHLRLARSANRVFLRNAPPGHYASPIPDLADRPGVGEGGVAWPGPELTGIDLREDDQLRFAAEMGAHAEELPFPDQPAQGHRYHLDNEWFTYGDALALNAVLRSREPARIVEVGSGFSSAAMLDTADRQLGGATAFTFIEPNPGRLNSLLGEEDRRRCRIIEAPVQRAPMECFTALGAGDVLFIDSSHVAKSGSDLTHLMFEVLPALAPGVLVHFHDIPWPFEYPAGWFRVGRAWNEAYLLRAFLQYNDTFRIVWFGAYMASQRRAELAEACPRALTPPSAPMMEGNSSIWLERAPAG